MGKRTCSLEGCDRPHDARGFCQAHSRRLRKGLPLDAPIEARFTTPAERFTANTQQQGQCLIWTGGKSDTGYGTISVDGRSMSAHRYAWERANGPIPLGMVLDHICHNRACVTVEHLRICTRQQNNAHRKGPQKVSATGVRNVRRNPSGTYTAEVRKDRKTHRKGPFESLNEARHAAKAMRGEMFGAFAGHDGGPTWEESGDDA